jgi:amino acid transporter
MIPRSMAAAIAFGAVFYVLCIAVQTLGFGTDAAGVRAFAASPAPLGELAKGYVGTGMADVLNLAAIISAIGAGLGCASVAARMLFALGRDRLLDERLAAVSPTGAPAGGLAFVMALDLVILVVFGVAKAKPFNVFFYFATIGTLSLLAMYALTNVAAARFLAVRGARAELALPVAGIAVAGYVLYHNIWPVPDAPYNAFPYVVAGWLAVGVAVGAWRSR